MTQDESIARVSGASALQLVVINYELLLGFIVSALSGEDRGLYDEQIKKAQEALRQLINALDVEYPVAHSLLDLYIYVNKLLNSAYFARDMSVGRRQLEEAVNILEELLVSWRALEREENQARHVHTGQKYYDADERMQDNAQQEYRA